MRWLVNNTVIKLLVVVLCIKEIWLLLGVPSISNAIITFTTLGVIPGTNTSLSPLGMLLVSVAIGGIAALFLFHKNLEELLQRHDAVIITQEQVVAAPTPVKAPSRIPTYPAGLQKRLRRLSPASNWLHATAELWFWSLVVATLQASRIMVAVSLAVWRAAEPSIRKFDHWLDIQLHKYEPAAKALSTSAEATDLIHAWILKTKTAYDELSETWQTHKSE